MYVSELFQKEKDQSQARNIHVGIDIAGPVGTAVKAFYDGRVYLVGYNSAEGDYGATLITEHQLGDQQIWALHGHLSLDSLDLRHVGQSFRRGEIIAYIGDRDENGGWNPHLHFQLSWVRPAVCDLPGAVSAADLQSALKIYPDPRLVLGRLYE
jgi:murein DD-endopeptidase MepM/ murein hydrolase activator NlpD